MIRLQDLTPSVYYTKSRDFQFIGRLYDIVLNYVKTNADNLYNLPIGKNMNERLLNLLSLTLGFQSKHNYNSVQLAAICSVLPLILRNKGSLNAILIAVNALLHAEGIKQPLDYSIHNGESITLYLPEQLTDLGLLTDLLVYILPAGISCRMVKEISERHTIVTERTTEDDVTIYAGANTTDPFVIGRMLQLAKKVEKQIKDPITGETITVYEYEGDITGQDTVNLTTGNVSGKPGMLANATILKGDLHTFPVHEDNENNGD